MPPGMMLQDTSKPQSLIKEAVTVLTDVRVSITNDIGVTVGEIQMAVHPLF
jgi:hypothetical protein